MITSVLVGKMRTFKKCFNNCCNLKTWKNFFFAIINYTPSDVLDYVNNYVRIGFLPIIGIAYLDFKKINGQFTLMFNRKLIPSTMIVTVNIAIISTGVYWKMKSIRNKDAFTVISVILAYSLNITTCCISVLHVNIVGRKVVIMIHKIFRLHNLMAENGIPYTHKFLFRITVLVSILSVPVLLIIFSINFTLDEIMGVVFPYFIRAMLMSTAAQIAGGGLEMVSNIRKLLKNLKTYKAQYTLDDQIRTVVAFRELAWRLQEILRLYYDIYGVLIFINVYANSLEIAYVIGCIYVRGLQDTFTITSLIMYIPGNLIHLFLYTCSQEVCRRVDNFDISLVTVLLLINNPTLTSYGHSYLIQTKQTRFRIKLLGLFEVNNSIFLRQIQLSTFVVMLIIQYQKPSMNEISKF